MSSEDVFVVPREVTAFGVGSERGSMIGLTAKDPDAVRTYTVDWSKWPFPAGTSIASVDWEIDDDDKTLIVTGLPVVGMRAPVKVQGGVFGRDYTLACTMTTNDPNSPAEKDVRRLGIQIRLR